MPFFILSRERCTRTYNKGALPAKVETNRKECK